jgi:hypothetical protein
MNSSQLLELASKVFVNRDQEPKREADRKMKRKVDLITATLAEQSGRPYCASQGRGRGSPCEWRSAPLEWPHLGEEIKWHQCAYCSQEGH